MTDLMLFPEGTQFALTEPKKRGKHYVEPRGYAYMPGTGPEGETCGTCKHHAPLQMAKRYHKCRLAQHKWTHGRGSDILVRSPACKHWEADAPSPPITDTGGEG